MPFTTKIDYSNNRQIKQREQTSTELIGKTVFGLPFSDLSSGPNLAYSATTGVYENVVTSFTGTPLSTTFTFGMSQMNGGQAYLNVITPINSNDNQEVEPFFTGVSPSINPEFGNTVYAYYNGVSFDFEITSFTEYAPNQYSGTAISEVVTYSASTLDYSGDGTWIEVKGKIKTNEIIITEGATAGYVLGCVDSFGNTAWIPAASGGTTGATVTTYWTASTGANSVKVIGTSAVASGDRSLALGNTVASGNNSMSIGSGSTSIGIASFAAGISNQASGDGSMAIGRNTRAFGNYSFAGGSRTSGSGNIIASGDGAFNFSRAISSDSIASGDGTVVLGGLNNNATAGTVIGGTGNFNNSAECVVIAGSNNQISGTTFRSVVIAGEDNILVGGAQSAILGGIHNRLISTSNSVILGGNGITGTSNNTVYVPALNIGSIGGGPSTTDIGVDANGAVVNVSSDINLKENINTITGALDKILELRGVTYNWIDRNSGGNGLRIGFIAQEVEEIVPELTFTSKDGLMGVHYGNVTALLVEAIKELSSPEYQSSIISTEIVTAEDNNIELNYNGTHETAQGGGIKVHKGVSDDIDSEILINNNGDWEFNPNIKIKQYTPTSSQDTEGNEGNVCADDNYLYVKTANGWKRTNLESF